VTWSWLFDGGVARCYVDVRWQLCMWTMVIGWRLGAKAMLAITVVSSGIAAGRKSYRR